MECHPPINQQCEVYKDGVTLTSVPCTVAFFCPEKKTVATVILSDVKDIKELMRELKEDRK